MPAAWRTTSTSARTEPAQGRGKAEVGEEGQEAAAQAREEARQVTKDVSPAEAVIACWQKQISAIDQGMFTPASSTADLRDRPMGELSRRRGEVVNELESAKRNGRRE